MSCRACSGKNSSGGHIEAREEALIMRAAGDGLDVLRRPDASPAAVLGVVVAKAQAQQVA